MRPPTPQLVADKAGSTAGADPFVVHGVTSAQLVAATQAPPQAPTRSASKA